MCFLSVPGQQDLEVGQYLGQMTNQLEDDYGEGSFCTEFVSAGAKNYAYKVAVGGDLNNIKTVIKVRGISINSSSDNIVTFDSLKRMVFSNDEKITEVPIPHQIARLPGWRIVTRPSLKTWRVCLNKRRRINKKQTVPFGFKGDLLDDKDYSLISGK